MLLKRVITSDAFRIYFWPIVIYYAFFIGLSFLFLPMEPYSLRETVFLCVVNVLTLAFLWTLVFRYRAVKGESVGKRTMVLLIILSTTLMVASVLMFALKILPVLLEKIGA